MPEYPSPQTVNLFNFCRNIINPIRFKVPRILSFSGDYGSLGFRGEGAQRLEFRSGIRVVRFPVSHALDISKAIIRVWGCGFRDLKGLGFKALGFRLGGTEVLIYIYCTDCLDILLCRLQ